MDAAKKINGGERRHVTIKLWPPTDTTRQMLVERMTNNLSNSTIFTRKYGCLEIPDATKNAEKIEKLAFISASCHYEQEPDGDGSSAVQLYAKECSRLILEVLKGGGSKLEIKKDIVKKPENLFDISKGQRAFIEEEEALTLLGPLTEPENHFTKICFSNRSFGLGAARVAGPILASIKNQLKEVDLSDFVAGRPEAEALDVMRIFSEALEGSNLRYLNISDNALGEKGVRAFGKLLKSLKNLEELYLMNDGISKEAAWAVLDLLPLTESLKVLHFHNNMTGDEGAIAISEILIKCPCLEDFRCSSTRVESEGGVALSKALSKCKNLKKIDLRDNMFGVEAGLKLSEALIELENLTEIYLSYLNLEDDGSIAIANALKKSAPSLCVLEMAGNDITAEAGRSLSACISRKKGLVKLNLSENELKDDGVELIIEALGEGLDRLREVDLSQNSIRAAAKALGRRVVGLPEFELLNLNGNFISDEDVKELNSIFGDCPEKLGELDENDPDENDDDREGEGDDDENGQSEEELERKLEKLDVNRDD